MVLAYGVDEQTLQGLAFGEEGRIGVGEGVKACLRVRKVGHCKETKIR